MSWRRATLTAAAALVACEATPGLPDDGGADVSHVLVCSMGDCLCEEGYGTCGASAPCETSLRDHPRHCGGCDDPCFDGERCVDAHCVSAVCAPGTADCEDPSAPCETDLDRSDRHCGACGHGCVAGTRCVAGRCASARVTPRMPGSMLATTSARPWFRWDLAPGQDGARLQVCADAACAREELTVDVAGQRFRPTSPLAEGVHFWRVSARSGAVTETAWSTVWAFVVPTSGALGASDPPPLLDVDGDGAVDAVVAATPSRYQVRFGVGPGAAERPAVRVRGEVRAREVYAREVVPAGDLDGDGLGDAAIVLNHGQRVSLLQSNRGLLFAALYGSRFGAPRVQALGSVVGGIPGPGLFGARALGNAAGVAGMLLVVGNPPHCAASTLQGANAGQDLGATPCEGRRTAGDYDADGAIDLVEGPPLRYLRPAGVSGPELRLCDGVAPIDPSDREAAPFTADVDDDGYDDLVLRRGSAGPRSVLHGGPGGLDGTRCSALPATRR